MFKTLSALAVSVAVLGSAAARADDGCIITALRDVPSIDGPSTVLRPGDHEGDISAYQVDRGTLVGSFCRHAGPCWPETVNVSGRSLQAVKLVNCLIDRQHPRSDATGVFYALLLDRFRTEQRAMR